jgi:HAE1 family hydrophobic/amphiphilic exporter-1
MVFITGRRGQLFKDQSLTVTFALAFSLVVALTLVPMLAAGRRVARLEATGGGPGRSRGRRARAVVRLGAPRRRALSRSSHCAAFCGLHCRRSCA